VGVVLCAWSFVLSPSLVLSRPWFSALGPISIASRDQGPRTKDAKDRGPRTDQGPGPKAQGPVTPRLSVPLILPFVPGPWSSRNHVTNAQILPSLGRNLGSCGASATCNGTATIDLLPVLTNTLYEPRLQQLDLRFSRLFRLGGSARLTANFDVYNVFNASSVLNENNRYSNVNNQWQNVLQILGGRLVKFGAQFDF
jgi:hypothetical protein